MAPVTRTQPARAAKASISTSKSNKSRVNPSGHRTRRENSLQNYAASLHPQGNVPPTYRIDLSLPPRERYKTLAKDYKHEMESLIGLFDELLEDFTNLSPLYTSCIKKMSRLLFRRVYSNEETEELYGIHEVTGIDMHLLVAFNVVVDSLMGCTSGGVRVRSRSSSGKMMHFRTLDWGMDPLRKIVVQLEFVKELYGDVIARSVTYAGFVGIITGVRPGLSVSINFRPTRNNSSSFIPNIRYYSHCVLVLLGLRPSTSHILRHYILSNTTPQIRNREFCHIESESPMNLTTIIQELPSLPTTACYFIFSDGNHTVVFEKDHVTAVIHPSESFVTVTNNDQDAVNEVGDLQEDRKSQPQNRTASAIPMKDLVLEESVDRRDCMEQLWEDAKESSRRRNPTVEEKDMAATERRVAWWMARWPISNDCTHYWCLMDATTGTIRVCVRYLWPVEDPSESSSLDCH